MDVKHIAKLASLTLKPDEEDKLSKQFEESLKTIAVINDLDTTGIEPTSQVTGLTNVTREDVIDKSRILPQNLALSGANNTHNGYFVVPAILNAD